MLKKVLAVTVAVVLLITFFPVYEVWGKEINNYALDSVIVTLKKKYSSPDKIYDIEFFDCDYVNDVIDLMHVNLKMKGNKGHNSEKWVVSLMLSLNTKNESELQQAIKELKKHYAVDRVEKNYYATYNSESSYTIPNDSAYSSLYGLELIETQRAWSITTGSSNVKVGIIDSGIDLDHSDLVGNLASSLHKSFAIVNSADDSLGHGTHVAGIVGAKGNNSIGTVGVCWDVSLISLRYMIAGPNALQLALVSYVVSAINYAAENDIPILNLSSSFDVDVTSLKNAIENYDGLLILSAGNDSQNTCKYPANYNLENTITVIATDASDNLASWSNYHSIYADLAAPGVSIYSTDKDNGYRYDSGTSMAAPYVTGVAALIKSVNPSLSSTQIKNIILSTVDEKSNLSDKCVSGGRLNAFNAVMMAGGYVLGDIDLSGVVNSSDARLATRYAVGLETFTKLQLVIADMDGNGYVDSSDARLIERAAVGL